MTQEQETKIQTLGKDQDHEYTTIRVTRGTFNSLSKHGKFRETFEDIIIRLLSDAESKFETAPDNRSF